MVEENIIHTASDYSEILNYNISDFPLYTKKDELNRYDFFAKAHWHIDLEFIQILDGKMDFFINGKIVHLHTGDGLFINSKRLHYGFSESRNDCKFIVVIISPDLFFKHSLITRNYFSHKFSNNTQDYICLQQTIKWQKQVLNTIEKINYTVTKDSPNALRILSLSADICANVGDHLKSSKYKTENDILQNIVWKMVDYIHRHYYEKITINEIAKSGTVSRSKCCELFKKYLSQSPNNYLILYRIFKAKELLRNTNMSISEVALNCGFYSGSYFTLMFRRETGDTPTGYRTKYS